MRKNMKNLSSSPPVHVHISDTTPVHVHVKSQRTSPAQTAERKTNVDRSNLRPTATVRTRGPWIPAGRTSTREASYKWEGPTHCLHITPPLTEPEPEPCRAALRLSDLTSEEEEVLQGRISRYERKIDSLMTEVSSLKTQVQLRRAEQLNVSKQVILDQEEELAQGTQELHEPEQENIRLRRSMEEMLEEGEGSRAGGSDPDRDVLLRKLLEAEADGAAAAQEVSALREAVNKLFGSGPQKLAGSVSSVLTHQKELLLQKLKTFEVTNQTLRHLLRQQQESQMESNRLAEQKNKLLTRLADTEAENSHLQVKLQQKDKELNELSLLLDSEKETAQSSALLSERLQSTRARLQAQLRSREAENNRRSVQIKNLERAASQQEAELEQLREQKQDAASEREALRRATRAQKHRAERSEDAAGQLRTRLLDTEAQVAAALSAAEAWQSRHADQEKLKTDLELQVSLMSSRISELTQELQRAEVKGQSDSEALLDQLRELTSESTAEKLENQSLKTTVSLVEDRLSACQSELQQVRSSILQYENLLETYKLQVGKTRAEADEYRARLAQAEQQARSAREELEQEIQEVRRELLGRLAELEPLPEALRRSELQLQEVQDRERSQERRNQELGSTLTDLRVKMETQGSQMDLVRQKNKILMEENRQLQNRVETLERKLEEAGSQNSDLLALVAKRDKAVQNNQLSLEDKTRECSVLSRRLEEALDDARLQMSETRERAATKERSTQAKILELETQLSRTASETEKLKRSREEVERRYQSRVQDLKDRLEQSDSTNQSLQNYVQFLKTSCSNVFSEVVLRSSLKTYRPPSPI